MPVQKIALIEPVKQRLNSEHKPRWPFILLSAMALFLLIYFLIPMWLGDDIYLSILIPHCQWLILGLMGLSALLGARLGILDFYRRHQSSRCNTEPMPNTATERRKKFSIAAISQFLTPQTWSIELLQKLNPKQFTQMCLAYYEIKGIPHTTNQFGLTTGLNILIWQNDIVSKVVHCSNDAIVEMKALRQFLGVLVHERAHAGVYIHRGTFSEEVGNFAASHNIQLRNEYALLAKIEKLSERRKQALLEKTIN